MLGIGALLLAAGAAAAPAGSGLHPMRLLYVRDAGAEGCPAEAELRSAVMGRLGYDPFDAGARAAIFARIARGADGLIGSIELVDAMGISRGKRELTTHGADCAEMARAIALSMSIAIDPEHAALGPDPPAPAEESAAASDEPSPPLTAPAPTPALRPEPQRDLLARTNADAPPKPRGGNARRTTLSGSLGALSMLGVAPALSLGGTLTVQGRRGPWALGVGARLVQSPSVAVQHSVDLQATLAAGELSGCFRHSVLESCFVGLAGATWARAGQVTTPRTDTGAFGAAGGRLGIGAPLSGSVELFAQAEGLLVFSPIRPQVDGEDIWAAPNVAASLGVGFRAHFW